MLCPECKSGELEIYTTVAIRQHADDSWDMVTPFEYEDEDSAFCLDCEWEGEVKELEKPQ